MRFRREPAFFRKFDDGLEAKGQDTINVNRPIRMGEESLGLFAWERHSPEWRHEDRQSGDWRSRKYLLLSESKDQADCALQVILIQA
jgi:hypothetical protein